MKEITIPKRRLARWYFMKQANESNCLNIARFFAKDEACFVLYADLFYKLNSHIIEYGSKVIAEDEQKYLAMRLHNLIQDDMMKRIQNIYGWEIFNQVAYRIFRY